MDTIAIGTATNSGKIHLGTNLFSSITQHLMCKLHSRQPMTNIIGMSDAEGVEGTVALLLKHEVLPSRLCRSCFPPRTMATYQAAIREAIEQEKAAEAAAAPESAPTYPAQLGDDGRKWWVVECGDLDERLVDASHPRFAIAAVRKLLIKTERREGVSLTRAQQWVAVQKFKTAGPLTTAQAYQRYRRHALYAACELASGPWGLQGVTEDRERLIEILSEEGLEHVEGKVLARFMTDKRGIVI